jgi:glucose-1-phosphate cytidylyltransferase
MEVVILCGGKGTRMYPKTEEVPKPLMYVGNRPILWHIMKLYSRYGHKDFILLLGFKGELIREYFGKPENKEPEWKITFLNTGLNTKKGQRILKAKDCIKGDKFLLAYGDDLCSVNINDVIKLHEENGKMVTLTSVRLVSDFGIVDMDDNGIVRKFKEKPILDHWISGGYLVLNKDVLDYIGQDMDETDAFELLAADGKVQAFKHDGFWKTMNTIKDMQMLNEMWKKGELQKELGIENSDH